MTSGAESPDALYEATIDGPGSPGSPGLPAAAGSLADRRIEPPVVPLPPVAPAPRSGRRRVSALVAVLVVFLGSALAVGLLTWWVLGRIR